MPAAIKPAVAAKSSLKTLFWVSGCLLLLPLPLLPSDWAARRQSNLPDSAHPFPILSGCLAEKSSLKAQNRLFRLLWEFGQPAERNGVEAETLAQPLPDFERVHGVAHIVHA